MLVLRVTFGQEQLNNDNSHINIAIDDRPGVYYEQMAPLRLQQADWKVSVFMEVQKFIDSFPLVNGKINKILQTLASEHELRGTDNGPPINSMKKRSVPL